jgi:hypothetical protein
MSRLHTPALDSATGATAEVYAQIISDTEIDFPAVD